jgi:hypothetical protein
VVRALPPPLAAARAGPAGRATAHKAALRLTRARPTLKLLSRPPLARPPPPGAVLLAGWAAGRYMGLDEVTSATYLVSRCGPTGGPEQRRKGLRITQAARHLMARGRQLGRRVLPSACLRPERSRPPPPPNLRSALCIAAIACLAKQESARTGNALGLIGVTGGVVATLGGMDADAATYAQVRGALDRRSTRGLGRLGCRRRRGAALCAARSHAAEGPAPRSRRAPLPAAARPQVIGSLAAGGIVGNQIASRIKITDLPQVGTPQSRREVVEPASRKAWELAPGCPARLRKRSAPRADGAAAATHPAPPKPTQTPPHPPPQRWSPPTTPSSASPPP